MTTEPEAIPADVLEPCPFCGGEAKIIEGEECAYVQCVDVKVHRALWFDGDNNAAGEVAEQWNRRAALEPAPNPAGGEKKVAMITHIDHGKASLASVVARALTTIARPAPEAGSDDLITDLRKAAFTEPEPGRHSLHLAAIEKIERLERERDDARKNALENGMELCRQRSRAERLWKAIDDALGRHQVTHIHADLRAALQQEGKSDV